MARQNGFLMVKRNVTLRMAVLTGGLAIDNFRDRRPGILSVGLAETAQISPQQNHNSGVYFNGPSGWLPKSLQGRWHCGTCYP